MRCHALVAVVLIVAALAGCLGSGPDPGAPSDDSAPETSAEDGPDRDASAKDDGSQDGNASDDKDDGSSDDADGNASSPYAVGDEIDSGTIQLGLETSTVQPLAAPNLPAPQEGVDSFVVEADKLPPANHSIVTNVTANGGQDAGLGYDLNIYMYNDTGSELAACDTGAAAITQGEQVCQVPADAASAVVAARMGVQLDVSVEINYIPE